jgi:tetrapyrrole methylase family protein/MazG family protein
MPKRTSAPVVPAADFDRYVRIVRRLRKECPWDRKQTHRSLRSGLIEEAYEVVETIEKRNYDGLGKELGDILLHVLLHAVIAEENGEFSLRSLLDDSARKLIHRHPHVFGTAAAKNAKDVLRTWEALKMREGRKSLLEGVPRHLPALQRAQRIQQRASTVRFDWKKRKEVWKKVKEEVAELEAATARGTRRDREEEFGDLLFSLVNYARFVRVDPEHALRATIDKFTRRFHYIERTLRANKQDIHRTSLEEMDRLWNEAKARRSRKR